MKLSKDVMGLIARPLDLSTLFNFSLCCKQFNQITFKNYSFWVYRLENDCNYPIEYYRKNKTVDDIKKFYRKECELDKWVAEIKNTFINSLSDSVLTIKKIFNREELGLIVNEKIDSNKLNYRNFKIVTVLYDFILPKCYQFIKNKSFWNTAMIKLDEFYTDYPNECKNLYEKHMKNLKELGE